VHTVSACADGAKAFANMEQTNTPTKTLRPAGFICHLKFNVDGLGSFLANTHFLKTKDFGVLPSENPEIDFTFPAESGRNVYSSEAQANSSRPAKGSAV
jgi:hypothetical protein